MLEHAKRLQAVLEVGADPQQMKRRYAPYVMFVIGLVAFGGFGIAGWGWLAMAGWMLAAAGALMHTYFWVKENWRRR